MHICVLGDSEDLSTVYIAWLARRRGIDVLELREDTLGYDWSFTLDGSSSRDGHLVVGDSKYPFTDVSGVFVRLNPRPLQPPNLKLSPQNEHAFIVERRNGIQYLLDYLPMVVANRPSAGRSNGSKPYQMRSLAAFGFEVPKWLTSNEEVTIKEFAETCSQGVIYKACSGLRSRVRKLDDEVLQRMKNGSTPVVVQEYIPGRDVRVHTVSDKVFPTEVVGGGVDYRFEHEHCLYRATVVPDEIADMCCRFAKRERLVIAGFDFRVTDDGQWFCLEMNPVPTFLPYEMSTTQPIGDALLDLMTA